MNLPILPRSLFFYGIKPKIRGTEKIYPSAVNGLHLAGFDVETIGSGLFRRNDLCCCQIVADNEKNSHIFFPKRQEAKNLDLFFVAAQAGVQQNVKRIFATAHNASFDIGALLGTDVFELMKGYAVSGWKGKIVDGNSCFAILRHKETGRKLTIADSMAWFKGSLKTVASTYFGSELQKYQAPEYLGRRGPKNNKEWNEFCNYAEQDALIQFNLTKLIAGLCKEGDVSVSLTPAQLSGKVFLHSYLKDRLFLPSLRLLEFIAKTYHGAQFTAFGRGSFENIYYYDINSLYPFAAMNVPLNFSNTKLEKMSLQQIEQGWCGFVGCKFEFSEGEQYPCLPQVRMLDNTRKIVFPRRGISYCTTEELKLALKKGATIHKLMGYGWFPEQQDINHPLGEYMRDIYARKQQLDEAKEKGIILSCAENNRRYYYKLLLNSLIGKFCQRNTIWLKDIEVAGNLFKPEFGSLILSKARAIINELTSKYSAIYSDTDCLMTPHSLPTGSKIGELKNELGNNAKGDLLSIRSKLYFITRHNEILKCARHGFRQAPETVYNKLIEKPHAISVRYSLDRMIKLKESYKRHCLPRRFINQTFTITLQDDGKREYDEQLNNVNDLLNGNTMSIPLQPWSFETQP
jgi:hypothetical protein